MSDYRHGRTVAQLPDPVKVNVGFWRRVNGKIEHCNVQGVKLPKQLWIDSSPEARQVIMQSKPKGDGWVIGGYALAKGQEGAD